MRIEGWLLDVHENEASTGMVIWLVDENGHPQPCNIPWTPVLHVHASVDDLDQLEHWLMQPEIVAAFFIESIEWVTAGLDLEHEGRAVVLEIHVRRFHRLRGLAEHIEARGDFHRYTLYSVDAHFVQRFLNACRCSAFQRVSWDSTRPETLNPITETNGDPPFHIMTFDIDFKVCGDDNYIFFERLSTINSRSALRSCRCLTFQMTL